MDYPLTPDGSSLLVLFGLALAMPVVLWVLVEPVRIIGFAAVLCAVVVLVRAAQRIHRADHAFHVPGTEFDIEITVRRSTRQ